MFYIAILTCIGHSSAVFSLLRCFWEELKLRLENVLIQEVKNSSESEEEKWRETCVLPPLVLVSFLFVLMGEIEM